MRIFIGWDSRFPEPGKVLASSLRVHSSIPLDIRFLDLRHLRECYDFHPEHDPKASTEFTRSRFLVPWLCDYQGLAIFMDNDMTCLADIGKLCQMDMDGLALRVRKHEQYESAATKFGASGTPQEPYFRKLWSSLMIMNCAKLRSWTKGAVESWPPSRLHRFQDIPDGEIGEVPDGWNDIEHQYRPGVTKLYHLTGGGPHLEGCENVVGAEVWYQARLDWLFANGMDTNTPVQRVKL